MKTFSKLFCFYLILFTTTIFGQKITLTGKVVDSIFKPIPRASIVASYDKNEVTILTYTTSKENGSFVLNFERNSKFKEFWISFRHISYGIKKVKYKNRSQKITVSLDAKNNLLQEVVLKAKKNIEIKGDTITYNVKGLKKEKDYSIEEVISRIPGVKIAENGQISYNNRIISHLYINGVDLLEGRYNIATRGIPAGAVKEIDIMKNHNHARIDKGITDSEDVAFNLKIKKNHSLIFGSGKADIGFPLVTRNLEITPIYLKEKFQDIASGKTNNIGKSLQNNGVNLTATNRDFSELEIISPNILTAPNINGTSISNKYWLNNNSYSLTNDALIKSGENLILKAGLNYNKSENALHSISKQRYFFDTDTTNIKNSTNNQLNKETSYVGLVQEINKKTLYLKNKTIFNSENSNGISNVIQNENFLDYKYKDDTKSIKNLTEFKTKVNNQILNTGLLLKYTKGNENTEVLPSVFNDVITSTNNPEQTNQNIHTEQFSLGGYSAYNFKIGKLKSQLKQRINWNRESLTSNLAQSENSIEEQNSFPFKSYFKLNTFESTTSFESSLKFRKLTFTLNPSIKYINLNKQELLNSSLNKRKNYFLFQPRVTLKYKVDHQWNLSLTGNYLTSLSRFPQLFNGLILKNYRSLYRNPEKINITRNVLGILNFGYTNILEGFMFSNTSSLSESNSDFITSSSIDSNGLIQTEAINTPNKRINFTNTTSLNKSFFRILKTDLKYTFNQVNSNQIFNNIEQKTNSIIHSVNIGINIDNNTWYAFKYNGLARFGQSKSNGYNTSNTFLKHNLELDFYTSSKTRINLETESVFTSFSSSDVGNKNRLFNTSFYYKPSKKIFFRASFNNILNEKFFSTIQSSSNFVSESKFSLRPRQFTIGLNFSF